jgi:hypothetical protein
MVVAIPGELVDRYRLEHADRTPTGRHLFVSRLAAKVLPAFGWSAREVLYKQM